MTIEALYKYLPTSHINWELILNEILAPFKEDLKNTNQEKKWHGEENVLIHTQMVCEELIKLIEYQELEKTEKLVLFLAALFHDIAKPKTTVIEDNEIHSPGHGPLGAIMTREYLWKNYNLCGEYLDIREGIALLIKYHTSPLHIDDDLEGRKKLIRLSLNQKLTKYFSIKNLTILSKADVLGRISNQIPDHKNTIANTINIAKELTCYDKPFEFSNSFTKFKYLSNENVWYYDSLYDSCWGEVILLSGLPGVGKDTYISNNYKDTPIISLDNIRAELKISPLDDQGVVVNEAINRAKELLRKKKPFIWNATNISYLNRKKLINIITDYNAKAKIIYLETNYKTNIIRNNNRVKAVPVKVINDLIRKYEIPESFEAHEVIWIKN